MYFTVLVTMMKGEKSALNRGKVISYIIKVKHCLANHPTLRSLKTVEVTGGKRRLCKSPKHKHLHFMVLCSAWFQLCWNTWLIWKKNSAARSALVLNHAQRWCLKNIGPQPHSSLASPVDCLKTATAEGAPQCQDHGASPTCLFCPPLGLFTLKFTG